MKAVLPPENSKNIIAITAIGEEYYNTWEDRVLPGWLEYCERNKLGLVVFHQELISRDKE